MKAKSILFLIATFAIFTFASCNSAKESKSETEENTPQTEEITEAKSSLLSSNEVISEPIHITTEEFKQLVHNFDKNPSEWVYEGDKPCIIDFWAEWCAPCRAIAPILDEVAKEYAGQVYVYKVDVDAETTLGHVYGIQSIPTLLFVPLTGDPKPSIGLIQKEEIMKNVNDFLLK